MAEKVLEVRMLTALEGPDVSVPAGGSVKLPQAEAKRYLDAGLAEPVARTAAQRAEKR